MQEVSRVREGRVPCLLAGDFNAEPYTDPHRLLTKGNFSLIRIRIQVQKKHVDPQHCLSNPRIPFSTNPQTPSFETFLAGF